MIPPANAVLPAVGYAPRVDPPAFLALPLAEQAKRGPFAVPEVDRADVPGVMP